MRTHALLALAAASLGAVACTDPAPRAPTVVLARPGDTLQTPYRDVTEAVWLGGERWAVVAPADQAVAVVDLGADSLAPLGSLEVLPQPQNLFALGDTVFVSDWFKRRLTVWGPDGRLVDSIPAPDAARGALPQARDAAAQWYAEVAPLPKRDGSGNRDSAAVVRLGPGLERADTAARLAPLDIAEVQGDQGKRFERRVFSGQDEWGVLRDGTIWVARVYQNRVDWIPPRGEVVEGDPLPDRVLEVTRVDREIFKREFPPELRQHAEELPYSPIKPPFEKGFTSGAGQVWLEKSRAAADTTRRYHVVDRRGRLLAEMHLPGYGRILAVDASGTALVAERSEAGVRLGTVRVPGAATP
jgi:hypothetical protein